MNRTHQTHDNGIDRGWTEEDSEDARRAVRESNESRLRIAALKWAMDVSEDPDPPAEAVEMALQFLNATRRIDGVIGTEYGIPPKLLAPLLVTAFGDSYIDAHLLDELIDITRGKRERADARRAHDPFDPFFDDLGTH